MTPTADQARAILEPYHSLIRDVIEAAWAEWKAVQGFRASQGYPPMLYSRSISNYIFDALARTAIMGFGAEARVRVDVESQSFKLHFKDLCARFKKGGEDKLGQNHPTQAALAFQEAAGMIPGTSHETGKVEIIWLPNEIWTNLDRILVVARDGDRLIWEYEVEREASAAVVLLPTTPSEPDADGPLIRPKPIALPNTEQQ